MNKYLLAGLAATIITDVVILVIYKKKMDSIN